MTGILVIEDDEPIRTALQRGLRDRGLAVASVATGVAALEHVIGERPDVVLLDLGLPDVDGLTLISMIRAASDVPIIVITAQDDDPTMVKALDARRRRLRGQAVRHRARSRPGSARCSAAAARRRPGRADRRRRPACRRAQRAR